MVASPSRSRPLSPADHFWLRMDHPTNLMMITGIMLFDEKLDLERLRTVVRRRIAPIRRFRQRIAARPSGRAVWEDDPAWDLDRHVYPVELPGEAGERELADAVGEAMSTPLDPSRALWEFRLIENFAHGSALIGRFHHCMGDGIGLMMFLLAMTDLEPDGDLAELAALETGGSPPPNPFLELFLRGRNAIDSAKRRLEELMPEGLKLMVRPVEAYAAVGPVLRTVASALALAKLTFRPRDSKTLFNDKLAVTKRAAWSRPIPFEQLKALRSKLPGTVNDILLTAMSGGIRRYILDREGEAGCRDFRATVPVNLRPLDNIGDLGNEFGLVYLKLPLAIADPVARLRELQRRMNALKTSAEPPVTLGFMRVMGRLPRVAQKGLVALFASKATAVVTNVPGPVRTLYLGGRPLRDMIFWVPRSGRLSLGVSILSYDGRVRMGVATDARLVPDPEQIVRGFEDEFEAMRRLGDL